MVQQLRERGIDHPQLLEAFLSTPRHLFVDEALSERAYGDGSLPIGWGQTISQPYIMARMIELLDPRPGDAVLEIGTGSGYQAALLARLGLTVCTIERIDALAERARGNWERAGVAGVEARAGDGSLGWPERAPFAGILIGAAVPSCPASLLAQLGPEGRLVVPIGDAVRQVLKRIRRTEAGSLIVDDHDVCRFVRLIGKEGFAE